MIGICYGSIDPTDGSVVESLLITKCCHNFSHSYFSLGKAGREKLQRRKASNNIGGQFLKVEI